MATIRDVHQAAQSGWKVPFTGKTLFQIGKDMRPAIDRFIMRHSLLPDQPVFDRSTFPWMEMLENNWEVIRDEALRLRGDDIPSLKDLSPEHGRIAADHRWKSFFLEGYGYQRLENCACAPLTTGLLLQIPHRVTATFSVLEAGGRIPRHYGMTKGMLTYHLPLRVPKDRENCCIQIEGKDRRIVWSWEDGKSLLFDDMYFHEVWNNTDEDRYILLIQVERPCTGPARLLQKVFLFVVRHTRFVQRIRKKLDEMHRQKKPV
ncbi:aspartyl/asparaginyl beta-hydroxylase domain-containing protein [Gluconobacter morbifer]|uniref:Aspartyl/asparaginy/proline hydroxylase domain-containing protein n=1 Tax=Gluconobacter morbifer G707 TaxID=1088869 RepID=G6XK49_9PROT|nr:aspartyl/asparaginyl beta-hydroxylase domain-containing protein [Gluconobacter morbifer]EHH68011.1 hypothetical protein GMO_17780 [Gluconobacter morbifer G707]